MRHEDKNGHLFHPPSPEERSWEFVPGDADALKPAPKQPGFPRKGQPSPVVSRAGRWASVALIYFQGWPWVVTQAGPLMGRSTPEGQLIARFRSRPDPPGDDSGANSPNSLFLYWV